MTISHAPNRRVKPVSLPLSYHWSTTKRTLPVRAVRCPRSAAPRTAVEAPPWVRSGDPGKPFDLSAALRLLCEDIALRCPSLSHIDVSRMIFGMVQARNAHPHGLQARVTPLRFPGGALTWRRGKVTYQVQRFLVDGQEMLYLVDFCLPRFLNQSFDEKFVTLFHELFHISPELDGDLRRHEGRYELHTHSKREYDKEMARYAREYLSLAEDRSLFDFLRLSFDQLRARHGSVISVRVPRPKLIPIAVRDG